jgi:TetR/AcrR family tetracycline transcriptional repressor
VSIAPFESHRRRSQSARAKGRLTLTLEDVVAAGAEVLDTKGVDGLSMRALATHLGTGPATLYWHVENKDQLLRLILDETLRPVDAPTDGTWQERLAAVLTQARGALLKRPVLVQVLWGAQWDLGPQTLRVAESIIALVAASGMPDEQVADAYFALITYVLGFVVAETAAAGAPPFRTAMEGAGQEGDASGEAARLYPHLVKYAPGADAAGMDRRFAVGLDCLITGL